MIFKDRSDAALQLTKVLDKNTQVHKAGEQLVIVSLLRGGVVLGAVLAEHFFAMHLPLVTVKIPSPTNPELAIGAICFDITYLDKYIVQRLGLTRRAILPQIQLAKEKQWQYMNYFQMSEDTYRRRITGRTIILVDDGIATGSTVKAACLYLKTLKPEFLMIAAPVAPIDFNLPGIDRIEVLHWNSEFNSVSDFYERFPQISNEEVNKYI